MATATRTAAGVFCATALLTAIAAPPAAAARRVLEPSSDAEDGELVDGSVWHGKPFDSSVGDLLLTLGCSGSSTYADHLTYSAPQLAPGQTVSDVRLRMNMQGGRVTAPLEVTITAALAFDPGVPPGAARFGLARTQAQVQWTISAAWDSSGQLIGKWAETPDLSPLVNEVLADTAWAAGPRVLAFFLEPQGGAGADRFVRFDDTHPRWSLGGNAGMRPARLIVNETYHDAFWGKEMLCRPTPGSMTVNVIPHVPTELYVEWGASPGPLSGTTATVTADPDSPAEITLPGLAPDTRYDYRLRFRPAGGTTWDTGDTHTFLTLPVRGSEARLCVTSDIHVTNQKALGYNTMMAQLDSTLAYMPTYEADGWHAWIDLGDLVVVRATRIAMDLEETEQRYRDAREYVDQVAHSVPFLFVRGNHEEVNGWDADGTTGNTAIWSGSMLLKWFSPPLPDGFYAGNEAAYPNLGEPGNYWACTIGDLRIRSLDPFLFSTRRPHNSHGETGGSLDGWDWTLGTEQYEWLYDDMVAHPTPYRMVLLHHLTSCYIGPGEYYGRGGIEVVKWSVAGRPTFEWGGQDSGGVDVLAARRPGWTHGAIHDMLVSLGNQVVLKGHEHFHARQELDGMVYLTLAKPDDTGEQTGNLWGWRYFSFYPAGLTHFEPNSGFLAITADPVSATCAYVQTYPTSGKGNVLDSFTLFPTAPTSAGVPAAEAPRRTAIVLAAPNPAPGDVRLELEVGCAGPCVLAVFDASGRRVRELLRADLPAGNHRAAWDGRDAAGRRVAAGAYFAKLSSGGRVDSVKLIVLH